MTLWLTQEMSLVSWAQREPCGQSCLHIDSNWTQQRFDDLLKINNTVSHCFTVNMDLAGIISSSTSIAVSGDALLSICVWTTLKPVLQLVKKSAITARNALRLIMGWQAQMVLTPTQHELHSFPPQTQNPSKSTFRSKSPAALHTQNQQLSWASGHPWEKRLWLHLN